jgi:hypothetical protein
MPGVERRFPHLTKRLHRLDVAICCAVAVVITILRVVHWSKWVVSKMVGMSSQMRVRQPNFGHSVGVSIAVPYAHAFVPTPNMSPLEIAYSKGADAARRGLDSNANPYSATEAGLSEAWGRGYNAIPKSNPSGRLKGGTESGEDHLGETGGEELVPSGR